MIAADHRHRVERADAVDDGVRRGAVADQVAEHEHAVPRAGAAASTASSASMLAWMSERIRYRTSLTVHIRAMRSTICSAISSAGAAPASIAHVRLRVGGLPDGEQPLHLGAVGGQRPPAVGRDPGDQQVERHVQPDRHAVQFIAARFSASMNVPPPVATTAWRSGSSSFRISRSTRAEVRLSLPREDVGDRPPLARFDQLVDVLGPPAETGGDSARATVLLPAAMNPTR